MILNELKIRDFGVFSGEHTIDLIPRIIDGQKRPIILFGGLNGAGKTTTLSAVRLALYGRASLGRNVSIQAYQEILVGYIHKPKKNIILPHSAAVELSFTYGKHGSINEFRVIRSWDAKKSKVIEHLIIQQDGAALEGLSSDQLQSFLNELIPIGVADLFFFDGEKIADLAEDNTNEALGYAIKRLLGLDIIDRLRADLGVYLREHTQSKQPKEIIEELRTHEDDYNQRHRDYQNSLSDNNTIKTQIVAIIKEIDAVSMRINDLGGEWAKSRQAEELRSDALIKEKKSIIAEMKELFADSIPLAMAPKALAFLLMQLKSEKETKLKISVRNSITKNIESLRDELSSNIDSRIVNEAISKTFSEVLNDRNDSLVIHDISDSDYSNILHKITKDVPRQVKRLNKLSNRLEEIEKDLEQAATNIARAPEQSRINDVLTELNTLQSSRIELEKQLTKNNEEAKKHLRETLTHLRRLRDLDEGYRKSMSHAQGVHLAANTRMMLEEFGEKTKARKLAILEQEFIKSFNNLARKDDMDIQVHIDPQTFSVTLTDSHGKTIRKEKLSAGEKQIYAIAMLEALGRTSGRNLPIIIDTPLGRLDSKHRTNLIQNYFPTASHQVLILSTDTEIDEEFYRELSPAVSHAFSVDYDSTHGSSTYNEGYFWRLG